ncbi:MAG TPA: acyltransferase [Desulfomonilia bacterium]|jgi:maltose O-acetyltransferase
MKIGNLFIKYLKREYHALLVWKKRNYMDNLIKNGLTIGKNVEIIDDFFFDPSHCFLISIGDNCTICPKVRLIAHDASTKKILGYTKIGKINIRERCFIGDSVIVLPKVTIGPDAVIGAGSVVTRDIPPNSVAAGNPAKVIATLDEYMEKIRALSADKGVFGEDYLINNLDLRKRLDMLNKVGDSYGFIV